MQKVSQIFKIYKQWFKDDFKVEEASLSLWHNIFSRRCCPAVMVQKMWWDSCFLQFCFSWCQVAFRSALDSLLLPQCSHLCWVMGWEHHFIIYPLPELLKDTSEENSLGRTLSDVIVAEIKVQEWWGWVSLCLSIGIIFNVQAFQGLEVFPLYKWNVCIELIWWRFLELLWDTW